MQFIEMYVYSLLFCLPYVSRLYCDCISLLVASTKPVGDLFELFKGNLYNEVNS